MHTCKQSPYGGVRFHGPQLSGTPGLRLTPGRYTDRGERSRVGGGVEEKTAVLLQGANQMQELRRENEHLHRVLRQMEGDMEGLMGFKKEVERLRMERAELDAQLEDRKNEVHRVLPLSQSLRVFSFWL